MIAHSLSPFFEKNIYRAAAHISISSVPKFKPLSSSFFAKEKIEDKFLIGSLSIIEDRPENDFWGLARESFSSKSGGIKGLEASSVFVSLSCAFEKAVPS